MPLLVIAYAHTNAGDSVRSVRQKEPTSALGGWILVHVLDLWLHLGTQARLSVGSESGQSSWAFGVLTASHMLLTIIVFCVICSQFSRSDVDNETAPKLRRGRQGRASWFAM